MARPVDPNLRIELLAAAEAEFARRGVEATRIEDIVARARRSKGAFYQYFNGKDDIFRHLVEGLLARLGSLVATPLVTDEKHPPTQAQFLALWLQRDEAIFEFIWANRDLVRLILRGGYSPNFGDLMDAFAQRLYDVIFESLEWGKQHRVYRRDFNAHLVAVMIAGAYDRLARELVDTDGGRPNIKQWITEAQAFTLKGIID
jgi:AcrR family transcriptional regulator